MRADTQAAFDRLGDWERVIASHFAGEGGQAGPKSDWTKVPGYDYNQNPSIREYVDGVEQHIKDADPSMFGQTAPAPLLRHRRERPRSADPESGGPALRRGRASRNAGTSTCSAPRQTGRPDPTAFDRSELTQWAAHQAGIEIPDGSAAQYLDLKAQGLLIPVEQAAHTPGALLFSFSSEPTAGGERPTVAHVAISQGNGSAVEADETRGVTSMEVGNRFQYAAVLPGLQARDADMPTDPVTAPTADPGTHGAGTGRRRCRPPTRSTRAWTSAIPTATATTTG